MRQSLPLLLLLATVCRSNDEASRTPTARVSCGLAASVNDHYGLEGRLLVGSSATRWTFGVQGVYLEKLKVFDTPLPHVLAFHAVAGKNLVADGAVSATWLAGLGVASTLEQGEEIDPDPQRWGNTYQRKESLYLSALLGLDIGVSVNRVLGISLTYGAMMNIEPRGYAAIKVDIGSW